MDDVRKIKFTSSESLDDIKKEIFESIPFVKTEWELHEGEDGKPFFVTNLGRMKIEVFETYANVYLIYKSSKEENRKIQSFIGKGGNKKATKLNLYKRLLHRFQENEEYSFYKRVLRTLHGQLETQKKTSDAYTFTEDAISRKANSDS